MASIENRANELYHYQGGPTADVLSGCRWDDAVGTSLKRRIAETVTAELGAARIKTFENLPRIKTEHIEKALELAEGHLSNG